LITLCICCSGCGRVVDDGVAWVVTCNCRMVNIPSVQLGG
jgi:hypothetical protein